MRSGQPFFIRSPLCNAGFILVIRWFSFRTLLRPFIIVLLIIGGLGFLSLEELYFRIRRPTDGRRHRRPLSLQTILVHGDFHIDCQRSLGFAF